MSKVLQRCESLWCGVHSPGQIAPRASESSKNEVKWYQIFSHVLEKSTSVGSKPSGLVCACTSQIRCTTGLVPFWAGGRSRLYVHVSACRHFLVGVIMRWNKRGTDMREDQVPEKFKCRFCSCAWTHFAHVLNCLWRNMLVLRMSTMGKKKMHACVEERFFLNIWPA